MPNNEMPLGDPNDPETKWVEVYRCLYCDEGFPTQEARNRHEYFYCAPDYDLVGEDD